MHGRAHPEAEVVRHDDQRLLPRRRGGAPFPYYVTCVEPSSTFDLNYAVNALAMPMIGGTTTWLGP